MKLCPKCRHRMHDHHGVSITSTMENDGGKPFISGYSCIQCGKYLSDDFPAAPPICPLKKHSVYIAERRSEIDVSIEEHWPEIRELRIAKVGVCTIAKTLGLIGSTSVIQNRIVAKEQELGVYIQTRGKAKNYGSCKPGVQEGYRTRRLEHGQLSA